MRGSEFIFDSSCSALYFSLFSRLLTDLMACITTSISIMVGLVRVRSLRCNVFCSSAWCILDWVMLLSPKYVKKRCLWWNLMLGLDFAYSPRLSAISTIWNLALSVSWRWPRELAWQIETFCDFLHLQLVSHGCYVW